MGQGLTFCEGCYYTSLYECIGLSFGCGCLGCWMCQPPALTALRGEGCMKVGCNQGFGSTTFCVGQYCLIPDWLRDYSIWKSVGDRRGDFYNISIRDNAVPQHGFIGQ